MSGQIRFGDFHLDPAIGELRKSSAPVKLASQPFRVLALLAARPGDVVTRKEIRDSIWGDDTHVDFDQGLNSCIAQIRRAIGPGWIETLPKRGYRFVPASSERPRAAFWMIGAAAAMVLFAISSNLIRIDRKLPDTARASCWANYEHGVRQLGQRDLAGFQQAMGQFNEAIQSDPRCAKGFAGRSDTYSLMAEYSMMPAAEAARQARRDAEQALALDSTSPEAWTALAYVEDKFEHKREQAEAHYRQAIRLDGRYPFAHQLLAELLAATGRYGQAFTEIETARRLDPSSRVILTVDAYLHFLARRYDDAIAMCTQVLKEDPNYALAREVLRNAKRQRGVTDNSDLAARSLHFQAPDATTAMGQGPYSIAAGFAMQGKRDQALLWLNEAFQSNDGLLTFASVDPNLDSLRGDPRFTGFLRKANLE